MDKTEAAEAKKTSYVGLFSTNQRLTNDNKLKKFIFDQETLKLGTHDLIDVRTKLGFYLFGYIAGKFLGLQAIRALSKLWGASFQQHDNEWLVFRFAKDEDRQRILAGGLYFVYGRPLLLKAMPDCFAFKEDDISLTPVWAILPSLPLECWHPNALSKIGSRLGTPIAMDSLTTKMERVSYALILLEVDASKALVDQVEFMLPNGVIRKQPVIYEFTPKFCTKLNRFGHLKDACQSNHYPAAVAATRPAATIKQVAPKKVQPIEWTFVQRRHKNEQKQQHTNPQPAVGETAKPTKEVQHPNVLAADNNDQEAWLKSMLQRR
ncbi:hypothetical protein Salat_0242400 [Sesamum alatum]|uniref:DUF4283 domain-containing protein n=1 Tax=Sesamum alatum TaxID=300844 RepID=A0AAE1YZB7_9LAMI|nr:hypothetical protein Salat_0242400 [Sesamum alatum]